MQQNRDAAHRERIENVIAGLHQETFPIVKYNHPLFYRHTQEKFPSEFIYMKLCKFSNLTSLWLFFEVNISPLPPSALGMSLLDMIAFRIH